MKRGTTPAIVFSPSVDLSGALRLWVTFSQCGKEVFTLTEAELAVTEETVTAHLSQEQTLQLSAYNDVEMQLRVRWEDGTAMASDIVKAKVDRILKEGEIE